MKKLEESELKASQKIRERSNDGRMSGRGHTSTEEDVGAAERVSRLNAQVSALKLNEEKLLQKVRALEGKKAVKFADERSRSRSKERHGHAEPSREAQTEKNKAGKSVTPTLQALEERVGEQEVIILEQREDIVRLERERKLLIDKVKYDLEEKEQIIGELQSKLRVLESTLRNANTGDASSLADEK